VPGTYDNLDLNSPTGSSLVGFIQAGTGAVATTVQTKLRETVSIKDFGAVGDGVTDDTVAIQTAINARVPLNVPVGNYLITASLVLPRGTTITGQKTQTYGIDVEAQSSKFIFSGIGSDNFGMVPVTSQNTMNIRLDSMFFEGDNICNGFSAANPSYWVREVQMRDCSFKRFVVGIDLALSWASRLDNVAVAATSIGLKLAGGTSHTWTHLRFDGFTKATNNTGVYIDGNPTNIVITGGFIQNYKTGFYLNTDPDIKVQSVDLEYMDVGVKLGNLSNSKAVFDSCAFGLDDNGVCFSLEGLVSEGSRIYCLSPTGRSAWFSGASFAYHSWALGYFLKSNGGNFNFTTTNNKQAFFIQAEYYEIVYGGLEEALIPYISQIESTKFGKIKVLLARTDDVISYRTLANMQDSLTVYDATSNIYYNEYTRGNGGTNGAVLTASSWDPPGSDTAVPLVSAVYFRSDPATTGIQGAAVSMAGAGVPLTFNDTLQTITVGGTNLQVYFKV